MTECIVTNSPLGSWLEDVAVALVTGVSRLVM